MITKETFIEMLKILQDSDIIGYVEDKEFNIIKIWSGYNDMEIEYDDNYIVNPRYEKLKQSLQNCQEEVERLTREIQELEKK
jgi:prefoldin subunit 5